MNTQAESDTGQAPPPRWVLKLFTRINVIVYRLSGGRLMNKLADIPIMLVKMKGAKSNKMKTIPLMYVPYKTDSTEKGFVLVASQGGAPKNPIWYYSVVKNPEVEITFEGSTHRLKARRASDTEKAEIWPTCVKHYPPYQQYQNRTERNIPVFLCE